MTKMIYLLMIFYFYTQFGYESRLLPAIGSGRVTTSNLIKLTADERIFREDMDSIREDDQNNVKVSLDSQEMLAAKGKLNFYEEKDQLKINKNPTKDQKIEKNKMMSKSEDDISIKLKMKMKENLISTKNQLELLRKKKTIYLDPKYLRGENSLEVKESTPYLPLTTREKENDARKGKQFIDPRFKTSFVYGHKFQKSDNIYLIIYVFFFLFVIEISMVIVFFFKQNKSYIANHMTLNFFCMLGQTVNNIVYYSKKSDFEIDEWSFWFEVFIFLLFVLQVLLGNMLNKRLLNPKLVKKIFVLRVLHRVSALIIYVGTKGHIFYINYSMFYREYKLVFYILSCMGVLFYVMLYLTFYFCLLDVKHYEFNGPFLVDTSKNSKALKEMLINIENNEFEQPNLRQSFEMKLDSFDSGKKCPYSQNKSHGKDNDFFGIKNTPNLQILPEESMDDVEAGKIERRMSNVNPVIPWFMLEDKIFDLRNLRHPKGLYILYSLAYQDITREIHGLKSMRFENKDEKFFKNLKHCHVNRTFHLIKKHCIGFIDTNKNLIVKDKSKKLLSKIKSDLRLHKSNVREKKETLKVSSVTDDQIKTSVGSRSSFNSMNSSSSMGFTGNLMNYVDKNQLRNKYSHNWQVHSKAVVNRTCSLFWIWTKDHSFLLNMKNYWIKNFGKYFFLKKGDLKQFHYICMAAHPKYLSRKYLTFATSPNSILNFLFLKMPPIVQNLTKSYLGFNLLDMSTDYSDAFLPPELFTKTSSTSSNSLSLFASLLTSPQDLSVDPFPYKEIFTNSFVKDKSITYEIPDEISSLDTPLSQFIPLIETPINKVPLKKNILESKATFELKSGLGLGLNFGNFTNKKIVFVVKDWGIVPLLDFLEVLLQTRILQLSNLILEKQRESGGANWEVEEHSRIEERLNFVREKVDEFKAKARIPGEVSDFTYETIRPFDEEYLLTFSNRPEFRIYWELNYFTFNHQKDLIMLLGLQILKEFEVVDSLVENLSGRVEESDYIPSGIQAMDEFGEIEEEVTTETIDISEVNTRKNSQEAEEEWGAGLGHLSTPKLVHKIVVNTANELAGEFHFEDKIVSVVNKNTQRLKSILEIVGSEKVEKLILSGSDEFNSRVLKDSPIPLQYVTIL